MLTSTEHAESTKPSILDCLRVLKNLQGDDFHTKLTAIQNMWNQVSMYVRGFPEL